MKGCVDLDQESDERAGIIAAGSEEEPVQHLIGEVRKDLSSASRNLSGMTSLEHRYVED
jgi:hypothetical protein